VDYKRIEDKEAINVLQNLKEGTKEDVLNDYFIASLALSIDIRVLLRRILKELKKVPQNLVTDPSKAKKNDIVIGKEEL